MERKINVALLFGGNSSEHDVSKRSALNIYQAINKKKYNVIPFLMTKDGIILSSRKSKLVLEGHSEAKFAQQAKQNLNTSSSLANIETLSEAKNIDIFFPIIHGNLGEDGSVQGLFKLLKKPYVGSGILASALAFDKDATKQILSHHHIRNTKYVLITPHNVKNWNYDKLSQKLGKLIFLKPANQGSSVGINQISNQAEFEHGLKDAFQYDYKILAEQAIKGPEEIEVAVMGNEHPIVSELGAVKVPKKDKFYTYQNKFVDPKGVHFEIPAHVSKSLTKEIKQMALDTYLVLNLKGMSRIDFLISKNGTPYVGEANTLPGFTNISLFPQLWKARGMSYAELIDTLINLGFAEFKRQSKLHHSFVPLKISKLTSNQHSIKTNTSRK